MTLLTVSLVIQGIADVDDSRASKEEISKAVDFTYNAVHHNTPKEREAIVQKMEESNNDGAAGAANGESKQWKNVMNDALNTDERRVMKMVKDVFADYFTVDAFNGMVANLKHGSLGLVKTASGDKLEDKQPAVEHHFVEVAVPT